MDHFSILEVIHSGGYLKKEKYINYFQAISFLPSKIIKPHMKRNFCRLMNSEGTFFKPRWVFAC